MKTRGIDHLVLNVADVERSLAWYVDLVGMEPVRVEEWRRGEAFFPSVRVSDTSIIDLVASDRTGSNMDHMCIVVSREDVDALVTDARFTIVEGPVTRFGARGDGWSVYVKDPDDNTVEFRSYSS